MSKAKRTIPKGIRLITVTVTSEDQKNAVVNYLLKGDRDGILNFPFGCRVQDHFGTSLVCPPAMEGNQRLLQGIKEESNE